MEEVVGSGRKFPTSEDDAFEVRISEFPEIDTQSLIDLSSNANIEELPT